MGEKKNCRFMNMNVFPGSISYSASLKVKGRISIQFPVKEMGRAKKKKDNLTINRIKKRERGRKGEKKKLKSRANCLIRSRDRK